MTTPRRRSAARPAGPPDVPSVEPTEEDATDAPAAQHRRRQRAPRGSTAGTGQPPFDGTRTAEASTSPAADAAPPGVPDAPASTGGQRDDRRSGEHRGDARSERRTEHLSENRGEERRRGESAMERSLRALVSTRTTQLPFDVAMRAREVAQPSPQDLADAERELVLVRRHYVPPAPLVTKKAEQPGKGATGRPDDARGEAGRGERRGGRRSARG